MCTSPERVSEEFSNQFLFARIVFGVVLFKNAAVFQSWIRLGVEAESGWLDGGGGQIKIWCSRKCVFDDRDQNLCTSPERVSEQFSNEFLFGHIDECFVRKDYIGRHTLLTG